VFSANTDNILYFRSLTGTNAHTQIVQGVDDISFTVPFSSTTSTGAIRIATQTEVDAGSATDLAVSPTGLATYVAANAAATNVANTGVGAGVFSAKDLDTAYLRSLTGTNAHTQIVQNADDISFTVPFASTTSTGAIRIATQAEIDAGSANDIAVSPTGLATFVVTNVNLVPQNLTGSGPVTIATGGPTGVPDMMFTGPSAGSYLVLFSGSVNGGNNASDVLIELRQGRQPAFATLQGTGRVFQGNDEGNIAITFSATVDGTEDLGIFWTHTTGGATTMNGRSFTLLKVDTA
jgi:hypothetical protein